MSLNGQGERQIEWYNKQACSLVISPQPWTKSIICPLWERRELCSWWRDGLRWRINYLLSDSETSILYMFIFFKKCIWFGAWFKKWSGMHSPLSICYKITLIVIFYHSQCPCNFPIFKFTNSHIQIHKTLTIMGYSCKNQGTNALGMYS